MLSSALQALVWQRRARAKLFNEIAAYADSSEELDPEEKQLLRSEEVAQIAELFFVLKERNLTQPEELREFVVRHNKKIEGLIAQCKDGYTSQRLSKSRLKTAKFSQRQVDQIIFIQQGRENTVFDQISVCKLLAELMSTEHCRKTLIIMEKAGFFIRHQGNDSVYVSSRGVLEKIYRDYLHSLIDGIQQCGKDMEKVA